MKETFSLTVFQIQIILVNLKDYQKLIEEIIVKRPYFNTLFSENSVFL